MSQEIVNIYLIMVSIVIVFGLIKISIKQDAIKDEIDDIFKKTK